MTSDEVKVEELSKFEEQYRRLNGFWRWLAIGFCIIVVFLCVNKVFDLRFFVHFMMYDYTLYYILFGVLLSMAFLYAPRKRWAAGKHAQNLFYVDIVISLVILVLGLYFAWHSYDIDMKGWSRIAPLHAVIMAVLVWAIVIEAVWRTTGIVLAIVILLGSFYPIVAKYMPGILEGVSFSFLQIAQYHLFSHDSIMGLLVQLFTEIVVGYILFGVVIVETGGGQFFLNLALSLVGGTRGGPAKVSVVSSALFGSVSGSSVANVLVDGPYTIPAMKKAGFAAHFAAAVETTASTAGTFTPPIMGATAFVMASFINVNYSAVALSAALPALMYYISLYFQIDGYAAKRGLRGLTKAERPSFWKTLKEGWIYIPSGAALLYFLFVLRREAESPYIATVILIVLAQLSKRSRFTKASLLRLVEQSGRTLMALFIVMAGVGMMVGSFTITGLAVTFARELVNLAAGNLYLILVFSAIASLIMGMGMPITACYVFLSIVTAPPLVIGGFNVMAVHLFILYFGMLSFLTPPVALCIFPAAVIAKCEPMKVGYTAMRLAVTLYILPFFFVLDPGLIGRGSITNITVALSSTLASVFLIATAFEGYIPFIGRLSHGGVSWCSYSWLSYGLRAVLIITGIVIGLPWRQYKLLGLIIAAAILLPPLLAAIRQRQVTTSVVSTEVPGSLNIGNVDIK